MPKFNNPDAIPVEAADVNAVACVLGLTDQRVRDMVKEGILTPTSYQPKIVFNLYRAVQDYIKSIKSPVAENGDSQAKAKLDQTRADADLKRAKATKAEIELDEFKGLMHRAEDVQAVTDDLIYNIRAGILSLPGRLAMDVASLDTARECSGRIRQECNSLLEELSQYEYDPKEYKKRVREREKMEQLEEEELRAEAAAKSGRKRRGRKAKPDDS